jgi:hypothetical protein
MTGTYLLHQGHATWASTHQRPDARDRHEPARDRIGLCTPGDLGIQLRNLRLQRPERGDKHRQNSPRAFRQGGARVLNVLDQRVGMRGALGNDIAILGRVLSGLVPASIAWWAAGAMTSV